MQTADGSPGIGREAVLGDEEVDRPLQQEAEPGLRDPPEELLGRRQGRDPHETEADIHGLAVLDPVPQAAPRLLLQLSRGAPEEALVNREVPAVVPA